jgi:hypothetical protein
MVNTKICTKCKIEKTVDNFYKKRTGIFSHCKLCSADDQREKAARNRIKVKQVPEHKYCSRCEQTLSSSEFNKNSTNKSGLAGWCKRCKRKDGKRKETANLNRKAVEVPQDKLCPKCKKMLTKDKFGKSKIRKDGLSSWCKRCFGAFTAQWTKTNRPKINSRNRNRRQTDPLFKIMSNVRRRILLVLTGKGKSANTLILVGCVNEEEIIGKLEALFWPGMTRENDGPMRWEIDHIVPLESFDKTDPNWQFKAFHWSNMQPLWRDDNRIKWHRLDWTPAESKHPLPERLKHFPTRDVSQPVALPPP